MKYKLGYLALLFMLTACASTGGTMRYSAYECTHTTFSARVQTGTEGGRYGSPWSSTGLARTLTCPIPYRVLTTPRPVKVRLTVRDGHSAAAILATAHAVNRSGETRALEKKVTKGAETGVMDLTFDLTPTDDTVALFVSVDLPSRDGRQRSHLLGYEVTY